MTAYNAQRYIALAIESILVQTLTDFELIIIDDGSRDRTAQVVCHYLNRDRRLSFISGQHRGIAAARNELLSRAKGELLAVMDADDIALPERLQLQVDFLANHPEVVCVGSAQQWIDEAGRYLWVHPEPQLDRDIQPSLLVGKTCINNSSAMMRREAVIDAGGYDESLAQAEDLDLFLRLGEIGQLANLSDPLIQYRQHANSISDRRHLEHLQLQKLVCERAWQRRGITSLTMENKPWRPLDRRSRHRSVTQYGWLFFNRGDRSAAIAYGFKALGILPWSQQSWALLISALVKPLPPPHEFQSFDFR
ncbi:MAG: glycosyltransferase [Nodosilinea sp. LVE1205-7]